MTERNEKIVTAAVVLAAVGAFALCAVLIVFLLRADRVVFDTSRNLNAAIAHGVAIEDALEQRVQEFKPVLQHADGVIAHAVPVEDAALARVQELQPVEAAALERVNELQVPIGTANKVLLGARLATDNVNSAALDERFYFEQQVPGTLARVDAVVDGLLPVEQNAAETLHDADAVMVSTASLAKHGDATAADVQQAVHAWVHPTWKVRAVNWTLQVGHAVAGLF